MKLVFAMLLVSMLPGLAGNPLPELPAGVVPVPFATVRTDYATYAKAPVWVIAYVDVAGSPARFAERTHCGFTLCDETGRWRGEFDGAREKLAALRAKILEKGRGRCALLIRLGAPPFVRAGDELSGELLDWAKAPAPAK